MNGKSMATLIGIWLAIVLVVWTAFFGIDLGGMKVASIQKSMKLGLDIEGGVVLVYEAQTELKGTQLKTLMEQVKAVMERRINAMGLTEPKVSVVGLNRVRIELPGVADATAAIKQVGNTAKLQFALCNKGKRVSSGEQFDASMGDVMLEGKDITGSQLTNDQNGAPAVSLEFSKNGAQIFSDMTLKAANAGGQQIAIVLDGKIISAPNSDKQIAGGNAQITGNFTVEESTTLAALIRGGALPVDMTEVQTSVIGPTLGKDSLNNAIKASELGFLLIILFSILYYRLPGVVACLSLTLYLALMLLIMVGMKATLTLPGLAGIVLSVGMAIDANVIIFERIKEDINAGKSVRASVVSGFHKALRTIIDSNITTMIVALVLYFIGEGPIKGFAVTLMIGLVTSMFTSVVVTQTQMMDLINFEKLNSLWLYGVRVRKEEKA